MAPHSSIPAWRIPWPKEPRGLQFIGSQRIGQLKQLSRHTHVIIYFITIRKNSHSGTISKKNFLKSEKVTREGAIKEKELRNTGIKIGLRGLPWWFSG